jgi:hypothetical protein
MRMNGYWVLRIAARIAQLVDEAISPHAATDT